jgi:hypothetical protein
MKFLKIRHFYNWCLSFGRNIYIINLNLLLGAALVDREALACFEKTGSISTLSAHFRSNSSLSRWHFSFCSAKYLSKTDWRSGPTISRFIQAQGFIPSLSGTPSLFYMYCLFLGILYWCRVSTVEATRLRHFWPIIQSTWFLWNKHGLKNNPEN